MAVDHQSDRLVTAPGEVVGATYPGQSETREGHDSTGRERVARLVSRRKLLLGFGGALALAAAGGAVAVAHSGGEKPTPTVEATDPHAGQAGPETGPVFKDFEKDLTLKRMKLPETLDAKTYAGVVASVGEAIQYAVNTNDTELLHRLVPGGNLNALQPGQFDYRAAYVKGYRESSRPGSMNYDPNNPHDPMYYPWGFSLELVEQLNRFDEEPTDEGVDSFTAKVRVRLGDLPALTDETTASDQVELPRDFEAEAVFTRVDKLNKDGTPHMLPDVDGKGTGWGLSNISQFYQLPPSMTSFPPKGFDKVPDLYKNSAF